VLTRNGLSLNTLPLRHVGGGVLSGTRQQWGLPGPENNKGVGWSPALNFAASPVGYSHPSAWSLPIKTNYISSFNLINGLGTMTGAGVLGVNIAADLTGSGVMAGTGELVASAASDLVGSSTMTGSILAVLNGDTQITGTGTLASTLTAIGNMQTDIVGTSTITDTLIAVGNMETAITPFTELSPQSLAAAVWAQALEAGYTAEEIVRLMSSTLLGKASGAGTGTIVFRDMNDTADRVSASVDGTGNRTAVTLDP